jgi:hypothetical protein
MRVIHRLSTPRSLRSSEILLNNRALVCGTGSAHPQQQFNFCCSHHQTGDIDRLGCLLWTWYLDFGRVNETWYSWVATWGFRGLFCCVRAEKNGLLRRCDGLRVGSRLEDASYHGNYHVCDARTRDCARPRKKGLQIDFLMPRTQFRAMKMMSDCYRQHTTTFPFSQSPFPW